MDCIFMIAVFAWKAFTLQPENNGVLEYAG